jgi:hypothetical protein
MQYSNFWPSTVSEWACACGKENGGEGVTKEAKERAGRNTRDGQVKGIYITQIT